MKKPEHLSKEEFEGLQFEMACRKELLKRLVYPETQLERAVAKEKAQREQRIQELSRYNSEYEILEAYGWEMITEEEKDNLIDTFRKGEQYILETRTTTDAALKMLREFLSKLRYEYDSFSFECLPVKEQKRIIKTNAERKKRRAEKMREAEV